MDYQEAGVGKKSRYIDRRAYRAKYSWTEEDKHICLDPMREDWVERSSWRVDIMKGGINYGVESSL